jgi:hypothetical protein
LLIKKFLEENYPIYKYNFALYGKMETPPWYNIGLPEIYRQLGTRLEGLTDIYEIELAVKASMDGHLVDHPEWLH